MSGADSPEEDQSEIARLKRVVREGSRGYADYWTWEYDRARAEEHAASVLSNFLERSGEFLIASLSRIGLPQQPPDMLLMTVDGRRIGIEVTELVDEDAVQRHRERRRRGLDEDAWSEWTPDRVAKGLGKRVQGKDRKLAKATGDYHEFLLAVVTDEQTIDERCARQALALCRPKAEVIGRAFLLLSYDGETNTALYPDGCVVLPVDLSQ